MIQFYIRRSNWIHKRYEINPTISGGEKIMKRKEKRKGILFWNEDEERLSMLYINNNGYLEKFQPLNEYARDTFV